MPESKARISASMKENGWYPPPRYVEKIAKPCKRCGKAIIGVPGRVESRVYCSYSCNSRSKATKHPCIDCGIGTSRKDVKRCRRCFALWFRGANGSQWKGGISPLNKLERSRTEYKVWREAVFRRDNYTCLWCGERGGELNADHIKPFAHYPELRLELSNGRTLCIDCHKKTDTYAGRGMKKLTIH